MMLEFDVSYQVLLKIYLASQSNVQWFGYTIYPVTQEHMNTVSLTLQSFPQKISNTPQQRLVQSCHSSSDDEMSFHMYFLGADFFLRKCGVGCFGMIQQWIQNHTPTLNSGVALRMLFKIPEAQYLQGDKELKDHIKQTK